MGWQALLEAMDGLQGIGMGIPAALEQHARSGEGVSRDLAEEWQLHRWRLGDPAAAMRALAPNARGPYDRFVLEVLVLCLERPSADHRRMLTVALARLRAARFEGDRPRGAAAVLRLALVLVALTAGEDLGNATERTVAAFGRRRLRRLRATLERVERSAAPPARAIENVLRTQRLHDRRGSWLALSRAAGLALAITLTALTVIVGGSAGLGVAGW